MFYFSAVDFSGISFVAGGVIGMILVFVVLQKRNALLMEKNHDFSTKQAVLQERLDAWRQKIGEQEEHVQALTAENKALIAENSDIAATLKQADGQLALLKEARQELSESFKAVSADIYRSNSESFLKISQATLAHFQKQANGDHSRRKDAIKDLVAPLQESLQKVDSHISYLEKERAGSYAALSEQVKSMAASQVRLQGETANLVRALRTPAARGRWGEMQLKRVVEMAGMVDHCDFTLQHTVAGEDGALRPDMVINLPNGKTIVVDAKASLQAYLEAQETEDDVLRLKKLQHHARQMRTHLAQLAGKAYWRQFPESPEFVVMFVPGENFFSAALSQDPELIEYGVSQRVILVTPTTLIALLRAVFYGWRQDRISEHAEKIGELGKTLYERLRVLAGHFDDLRKNLDRSVQSYNKVAGSFESRVLVTARRFQEIDSSLGDTIPELDVIDKTARKVDKGNSDACDN